MPWFERCYSRLLIDNHISEDDPSFMTLFDPAQYVRMVKRAGVDGAMVYACCHNGNCYYPTKVGHMHKNLKGRDIFGEVVDRLNHEGIVPIAYYTIVFHNNSAKSHPSWRIENLRGRQYSGRYWHSCPNSREYRDFIKAQIAEVVAYDVEGIFVDMTFWPGVCACHNCRERHLKETGAELPTVVDWTNEQWVRFQRTRERWLIECAHDITDWAKAVKPGITVTHNFANVLSGWTLSQSGGFAAACDYASGDFYGGKYQHSLGAKVFSAFSANIPFEFMTSRCVHVRDHTTTKSEEHMFCEVASTMAHGGAYFFIDAINPDGTLSEGVYDRLNSVAEKARPFKEKMLEHRPVITADVGLYFSMASHVDDRDNGKNLVLAEELDKIMVPHCELAPVEELLGTAIALNRANIPYRVVTSENLDLDGLSALIVNNCAFLSEDEVEKLRAFVEAGGTLIVTGNTSLYNLSGQTSGDFQLKDVFGVSHSGKKSGRVSYLAFAGTLDSLPSEPRSETGDAQFVLSDLPSPLVSATTADVLADVCGTYFEPGDSVRYASIHSDPPGPLTGFHGLTVNSYGKGKCVYLYSALATMQNHAQQRFCELLFSRYAPSGIVLSNNLPACVEVTLLRSTVTDAHLLCFVNYQLELPNTPVHGIQVTVRFPGAGEPKSCRGVSDGREMDWSYTNGAVTIVLPDLETLEMVEVIMG